MAKTNVPETFIEIYETPRVIDAPSMSGDPVASQALEETAVADSQSNDNSVDKTSDTIQPDSSEVPAQTADSGDKIVDKTDDNSVPEEAPVVAEPTADEGANT